MSVTVYGRHHDDAVFEDDRRWEGEGRIEATRTPGQQRRFARAEVDRLATAAHSP